MATSQRVWFERAFELGTPVESYPELIERLRGTPARLDERVRELRPGTLVRRAGAGWSIQEHVGHLSDLEALWCGRLEDLSSGREHLRSADLENTATWEAEHNDRTIGEILREFRERRTSLLSSLESLDSSGLGATALHPRLRQPMTVVDLCFFVAEHDDHHLATITALLTRAADSRSPEPITPDSR